MVVNDRKKLKLTEQANKKSISMNQQQVIPADINVLTGNWIRTNGGHRIEIGEVHQDGKVNAGYFNPRSINVVLARWMSSHGGLKVYIELRNLRKSQMSNK